MKRAFITAMSGIFCLTLALLPSLSGLCQELMPLSAVRPGMKGSAKTVFTGSEIEEFGVEVVDIITHFYPHQDLILAKLTGARVEHTGVVAGMSGSPVYIDGKLIGALSIAFGDFAKEPLAGVTPIEQMLLVRDREKQRDLESAGFGSYFSPYLDLALGVGTEDIADIYMDGMSQHGVQPSAALIPTPVVISGFERAVVTQLAQTLQGIGLSAVQGGSASLHSQTKTDTVVLPGSAISLVVIDGDMGIDIAGTVTWCSGDSLLAFGHQVFGAGAIRVPMGQTHILYTIPSIMSSNKMTMVTKVIGTLRQDRLHGAFGIVGEEPPMIPIAITCKTAYGETRTYNFRATSERQLTPHTPFYIRSAIINALVTSRLNGSDFSISMRGQVSLAEGLSIALDNYFSGTRTQGLLAPGNDITQAADEVAAVLAALMVNQFREPAIDNVDLTFAEIPGFTSAEISEVWYDKQTVSPGDTVSLSILLQTTEKGAPVKLSAHVPIPVDVSAKNLVLYAGSASQLSMLDRRISPNKFIPKSFAQLVDLLNSRRRNDRLYIQVSAPYPGALVAGAELPDLPASVLNVMNSGKSQSGSQLSHYTVFENSIPIPFDLYGLKTVQLKVDHRH